MPRLIVDRRSPSEIFSTSVPSICTYVDRDLGTNEAVLEVLRAHGLRIFREWTVLQTNGLASAEAVICVLVNLCGPAWDSLLGIRRRRAALAVMLITEHSRENMNALAGTEFDEFLLLEDLSVSALAAKINSLTHRTPRRRALALLREHQINLDAELAATLARACAARSPVTSVGELACMMGYSISQLERRWSRCTPEGSKPRHFIEWLRLVNALQLRAHTRATWPRVSHQLGVQQRTLAANAKRLFAVNLTQLERMDHVQLLSKLCEILGNEHPLAGC